MDLPTELKKYGIDGRSLRLFDRNARPDLIEYLDFFAPATSGGIRPAAVAESQGRPVLFVLDRLHPSTPPAETDPELNILRRRIACRGERTYLAQVLPGELRVVPVGIDELMPTWSIYRAGTQQASTLFSTLVLGRSRDVSGPERTDQVFRDMFDLLFAGAEQLENRLRRGDVLSLLGRALFFRFLHDRHIINEDDVAAISPAAARVRACFETSTAAEQTCHWLDTTFNGHFLRLNPEQSLSFFDDIGRRTSGAVFRVLSSIVGGETLVGRHASQLKFDWGDFDFAHVPVGLLSQVYEKFIWRWEHLAARQTSVHYTPRHIAATIVEEAFHSLPQAHAAKILDPACGAGVFLVLAFRRLYRELWNATGERPDTRAIRSILENQLTGFDISESALRLAALSLYLTAIELDPEPIPPSKLRFKDLRNSVLFNAAEDQANGGAIPLGSLSERFSGMFNSRFDLVVSNPPWTAIEGGSAETVTGLTEVSRDAIRALGGDEISRSYQNPYNGPDLPFLWRSTQWCKPDGRIAMALPGRILLKQEEVPRRARQALFDLVEVNGIINGSNLSDTNVWPEMQQPFLLLFARNRRPSAGHTVQFITPLYDEDLNRRGEVRIDSKSAQRIDISLANEYPWLWKALSIGTTLDLEVVERVRAAGGVPLGDYWERQLKLISRNGYQLKATQDQGDASFLVGLPKLDDTDLFRFVVRTGKLQKFRQRTAFRPRQREAYRAPLMLLKESPGPKREDGWALLSFRDVAYNQSFYGYSAAGHPDSRMLVRYLHLFVHSIIWMHYALLTSPKLGAERRTVYKSVIDEFPIIPLEQLSPKQKATIKRLSSRLERGDEVVFPQIDRFFAKLLGLSAFDLEVIHDTLEVASPYGEARQRACYPPTSAEREAFQARLRTVLDPFFAVMGKQIAVVPVKLSAVDPPFHFLSISANRSSATVDSSLLNELVAVATQAGVTRIVERANDAFIVGILNQYRYWTQSRDRLLAADLLTCSDRVEAQGQ